MQNLILRNRKSYREQDLANRVKLQETAAQVDTWADRCIIMGNFHSLLSCNAAFYNAFFSSDVMIGREVMQQKKNATEISIALMKMKNGKTGDEDQITIF